MRTTEPTSFVSLTDLEYVAGQSIRKNDRNSLKQLNHFPGKEFEDLTKDLRAAIGKGEAIVEAALPISIVDVKRENLGDPDQLANQLLKATGFSVNDLRVLWLDPSTGYVLQPGDACEEVVAACFSKKSLAVKMVQLALLEVTESKVTCRVLNVAGAIHSRVKQGFIDGPVLYLDLLGQNTQVFFVSPNGVKGAGSLDSGLEQMIEQVMELLELRFRASAAKLFFGDIYDFDEHADQLVKPIADKVSGRVGSIINKLPHPPRCIFVSGLPLSRSKLLCSALAERLQLAVLEMPVSLGLSDVSAPGYLFPNSPGLSYLLAHVSGDEALDAPFVANLDATDQDWRSVAKSLSMSAPATQRGPVRMYRGVVYEGEESSGNGTSPTVSASSNGGLAGFFKSKASAPIAATPEPARNAPPKKVRVYRGVTYEVD